MLSTIRSKATSFISYILIAVICLSFALWGVSSYFEGASEVDVASVNGDEIKQVYYQNQLRASQQRMRQVFQNNLPEGYFETEQFKQQTINQMVDEVLVNQIIDERRYALTDDELAQRILENQAFYTDGEFDDERYRRLLASNNMTVQMFENSQRKTGAYEKIQSALSNSFQIDDKEINDILKLKNQKRHATYFVVDNNNFEVQITDDEIEQRYEDFSNLYRTDERLKVDYVELSADTLTSDEMIEDEEIQQYFDDNVSSYTKPEVRKASHILIKPENDDDESDQAALDKANELIEKIKAGEDFAEIAKTISDDKGSANNGGDLGVITRGVMVQPFEDAVFAMKLDEMSDPVKTDFGYHIIKITELTPEEVTPLEMVRDEIATKITADRAIELFLEQAELFKNLAFESPESLQPIADELGLELKQTDWFSRNQGQHIASDGNVRNAAFSASVLEENLNSDVVEIGEDKLIAVRKADYEPSVVKPLEEVKSQIAELLERQRRKEMASDYGKSLLEKLREGSVTLSELTASEDYSPIIMATNRQQAGAGDEVIISKAVYEQPAPQADAPIFGGLELASGYALYQFTEIEEINDEELAAIEESERTTLLSTIESRLGSETIGSILASLREIADVQVFEENL